MPACRAVWGFRGFRASSHQCLLLVHACGNNKAYRNSINYLPVYWTLVTLRTALDTGHPAWVYLYKNPHKGEERVPERETSSLTWHQAC